jgi:LPXTG-motif cell wall-anchored protein
MNRPRRIIATLAIAAAALVVPLAATADATNVCEYTYDCGSTTTGAATTAATTTGATTTAATTTTGATTTIATTTTARITTTVGTTIPIQCAPVFDPNACNTTTTAASSTTTTAAATTTVPATTATTAASTTAETVPDTTPETTAPIPEGSLPDTGSSPLLPAIGLGLLALGVMLVAKFRLA